MGGTAASAPAAAGAATATCAPQGRQQGGSAAGCGSWGVGGRRGGRGSWGVGGCRGGRGSWGAGGCRGGRGSRGGGRGGRAAVAAGGWRWQRARGAAGGGAAARGCSGGGSCGCDAAGCCGRAARGARRAAAAAWGRRVVKRHLAGSLPLGLLCTTPSPLGHAGCPSWAACPAPAAWLCNNTLFVGALTLPKSITVQARLHDAPRAEHKQGAAVGHTLPRQGAAVIIRPAG